MFKYYIDRIIHHEYFWVYEDQEGSASEREKI